MCHAHSTLSHLQLGQLLIRLYDLSGLFMVNKFGTNRKCLNNNDFDRILHRFRHNYIAMSNKILSYRLQVALSIIKLSFWSNIKYGRNNCSHRPMTSDRCNVHYACCIFEIHTTKPFIVPEMTFKDHQMGRFTFCISLSLRPNGSALVSVRR